MNIRKNEGFTLIELIMVIIILGILAAVAVPRYINMVATAEEGAEDAVIARLKAGLEVYATEKLIKEGRRVWPTNPFWALETTPDGYDSTATGNANADGMWTFNKGSGTSPSYITHQRGDNTRYRWKYDKGEQTGDDAGVGSIGTRDPITTGGSG